MFGFFKGDTAVKTVKAVASGLDGLFTSDDERLTHGEVMQRIEQQPDQAQNAVNAIEARHRSIFVAGWRPFIGWVCGFALCYEFILNPIINWIVTLAMTTPVFPPVLDTSQLYTVLLGMLGLGGLRSYEKMKGISK